MSASFFILHHGKSVFTSVKAVGFLYNVGFTNPTVLLPAARRCSLIKVMIEAKMGAEALVPPTKFGCPDT